MTGTVELAGVAAAVTGLLNALVTSAIDDQYASRTLQCAAVSGWLTEGNTGPSDAPSRLSSVAVSCWLTEGNTGPSDAPSRLSSVADSGCHTDGNTDPADADRLATVVAKLVVDIGRGDFVVISVSIANCGLGSFCSVAPAQQEDSTLQADDILKTAIRLNAWQIHSYSRNHPNSLGLGDSNFNTAYCLAFRILPTREKEQARFMLCSDYGGG